MVQSNDLNIPSSDWVKVVTFLAMSAGGLVLVMKQMAKHSAFRDKIEEDMPDVDLKALTPSQKEQVHEKYGSDRGLDAVRGIVAFVVFFAAMVGVMAVP